MEIPTGWKRKSPSGGDGYSMKLILIRHGESVDDTIGCYGGAADYPLSDAGKRAAEDAARMLGESRVDRIYSSPFKRAMQTAEAINAIKQCGITTVPDLRERNSYGVMSGSNKIECKEIYGYLLAELKDKPGDYYSDELLLGAEAKPGFDLRVKDVLILIASDAKKNGYQAIVVVTHGNVTRSIYKNVLGFDRKIDLDHFAKTTVQYRKGIFTLIDMEGVYEK